MRIAAPVSRHSGFTLIEIVISILLLGIVASLLAPIILDTFTYLERARIHSELTAQARVVVERLSRELREADPISIRTTTANSSLVFTQLKKLTGLTTNDDGEVTRTYTYGDTITISQRGNSLNWSNGTTESTLTDKLASITFDHYSGFIRSATGNLIGVELVLSDGEESIFLYRTIHIRNTYGNSEL